jgi:hypothetical protein
MANQNSGLVIVPGKTLREFRNALNGNGHYWQAASNLAEQIRPQIKPESRSLKPYQHIQRYSR